MGKAVCSQHPADSTAAQTSANTKNIGRKSSEEGCWNVVCGKKLHLDTTPAYVVQNQHLLCWILLCSQWTPFKSTHFEESSRQSVGGGHTGWEHRSIMTVTRWKINLQSNPLPAALCVLPSARPAGCLRVRSTRAAPRLLLGLQRKRMCSVSCLLLSADGRRKFLLEVQITPQREGNTPCCP